MDKTSVDIAAAHDNDRAFIALERTQDTLELMARTQHEHMTAHIDMFFALSHGFRSILENIDHRTDEQYCEYHVAQKESLPAKSFFAKYPGTEKNADDKNNQGHAQQNQDLFCQPIRPRAFNDAFYVHDMSLKCLIIL